MHDQNPAVRELLSSAVYERAFDKVMSGSEIMLLPEERAALVRAKELTSTTGPGYPMPTRLDPTRNPSK